MLDTKLYEEELEKINFQVNIEEIDGIPTDMAQKIVRTDTNQPLGIVKSKYKPINHKEAFLGALMQMDKGGVSFKNSEIKIDAYENGAMAKMEVLLKDHNTKIGEHDLSLKFIARNSYNGRWKFQSFFG